MARAATRCGSPFFFLRALSARLAFRIRTCVAVFMGLVGVCECGSGLSQCLGVMGGAWVPRAAASWAGIIILSGACCLRILYFIQSKTNIFNNKPTLGWLWDRPWEGRKVGSSIRRIYPRQPCFGPPQKVDLGPCTNDCRLIQSTTIPYKAYENNRYRTGTIRTKHAYRLIVESSVSGPGSGPPE